MLLDTTELSTADAETIDAGELATESTESVEATAEAAIGAPSETENEATSDNTTGDGLTLGEFKEAVNDELAEVANDLQSETDGATEAEESTEPASEVNEADRRFWAEISVLGQITECNRNIEQAEATIDNYKCEIKEEKEFLKGEQIRLQRLASKLADIIEGKPLPIDPAKAKEAKEAAASSGDLSVNLSYTVASSGDSSTDADVIDNAWRTVPTSELLKGLPGLGAKKLESLCAAAPTAGHLEDLRGEASKAHQSFKEVLPKGCGQDLADKIEDRLISCVASNCQSAAEQAAEERAAKDAEAVVADSYGDVDEYDDIDDDDDDTDDTGGLAGAVEESTVEITAASGEYEDVE